MNKRAEAIITRADELKDRPVEKKTKQELLLEKVISEEKRLLGVYEKWLGEVKIRFIPNDKDVLIDKYKPIEEAQRLLLLRSMAIDDIHDAKVFKGKLEALLHNLYGTLYHYFKEGAKKKTQKDIDIEIEKNTTYSMMKVNLKNLEARLEKTKQYLDILTSANYLCNDILKERRYIEPS